MKKESFTILLLPVLILFISLFYYAALILNLNIFFPLFLSISVISLFCYYSYTHLLIEEGSVKIWYTALAYIIVCISITILLYNIQNDVVKYGCWDTWWFWNYRAKFFTKADMWDLSLMKTHGKNLPANDLAHADYPPGLSAAVAFFWRLFQNENTVFPYIISLVFAICTPLLIFVEFYKKSLIASSAVLICLFCLNKYYVSFTDDMLADPWVAFFLLAAWLSLDNYKSTKNNRLLILAGLMTGGLFWSKNEGLMLSFILLFFNINAIFSKANFKYFFLGVVFPATLFVLFKMFYSPAGDLFIEPQNIIIAKLLDLSRYDLIGTYFINEIVTKHPLLILLFLGSLLTSMFKREITIHHFYILSSFCGYFIIYAITPHDLEWHVSTSIDRIVWQFVPFFLYSTLYQFLKTKKPSCLST